MSTRVPDAAFEDIAAEYAKPRRCAITRRLFNEPSDTDRAHERRQKIRIGADNAVAFDFGGFDFADRNYASTMLFSRAEQLTGNREFAEHDHVRKKDGEGFVSDQRPRAGDGVGKPEWFFLLDVEYLCRVRQEANQVGRRCLVAFFKNGLKFKITTKVCL